MRSAPPVDFTVGRSRFQAVLTGGAWLAGLFALAGWLQVATPDLSHALAALVLGACAVLAWASLRRQRAGVLAWDASGWTWTTADGAQAVRVEPACDLQRALLVRLVRVDGRADAAGWLWLQRGADPTRWRDLRRAVYFSAGVAALPAQPAVTPSA